jgi:hypothetical protein
MRQTLAAEVIQPQEVLVRQAVPVIAERMSALENNLTQRLQEMFNALRTAQDHQRTTLDDVFSGRAPVYLRVDRSSFQQDIPLITRTTASSTASAAVSSVVPAGDASDSIIPSSVPAPSVPPLEATTTSTITSIVRPLPDQPMKENGDSIYIMSRTVDTVDQLWREWFEGFPPNPSVQSLELKYRAAWRQKDSEKTWYSRRKVIIKYICTVSEAKRLPASLIVQRLEEVRTRSRWSLHQLYKEIAQKKTNLLG